MKVRNLTIVLCLLIALPLLAQSLDGKWEAKQTTQRGEVVTTFDLKNASGTVTGTMTRGGGMPVELKNGKFEGGKVTFEVTQQGRGGGEPQTITYTGTLAGDAIKFTTAGGRGPLEIEAKRVK